MVVEGAKYAIRRPRVCKENQEVELPTHAKLQSQDLLDAQMRQQRVVGVRTRNSEQVLDGYSEKLEVSWSSVSRALVRASQKDLDSIDEGQLGASSFVPLMIESLEIGGRTVLAALGITAEMEKIPVGLREGDTTNSEVVKDLLASLMEHGFTLHCERLLTVIDGAKVLEESLTAGVWRASNDYPLLASQGAQFAGILTGKRARHAALAPEEAHSPHLFSRCPQGIVRPAGMDRQAVADAAASSMKWARNSSRSMRWASLGSCARAWPAPI